MCIERWPDFESGWFTGKIPDAQKPPVVAVLFGSGQFVARDVEWRALPAIRGLDLNQPR